MTHEIKLLFETLSRWQKEGKKAVFVSVVALNGTSYRKPGVRMIIREDGEIAGAVSGGCVENEIIRQAQSVFQSGKSKIMTYDGRLRIGCEGIITILIEPVLLSSSLLTDFEKQLNSRQAFEMETWYYPEVGEYIVAGSLILLNSKKYTLHPSFSSTLISKQKCFRQTFEPLFQLYIFGAEHDAVQLSISANLLGWEVTVVASPDEAKSCDYFPGAKVLITPAYNEINALAIDRQTAIVLITHSFNKDVQYLLALKETSPAYIGLLGSFSRRERVLSMILDYQPDISPEFLEQIHGPAGLNIGAVGAPEIAVSILAEILCEIRGKEPVKLRDKMGSVHE
jgi:xanthine/CO dehydrogenase XdhC/CoxF family maturation factor